MMDKHSSKTKNAKMSSGKHSDKLYDEEEILEKKAGEEEMDIEVDEYSFDAPSHSCGCGCKNHNLHY